MRHVRRRRGVVWRRWMNHGRAHLAARRTTRPKEGGKVSANAGRLSKRGCSFLFRRRQHSARQRPGDFRPGRRTSPPGTARRCDRYFAIFEDVRRETGYADYLRRAPTLPPRGHARSPGAEASLWLLDYPFAERLYPRALEVVARCARGGPLLYSPTGTPCSSRAKWSALVCGRRSPINVLIYVHKERELKNVERLFPARHYVMVDDKVRILTAIKEAWGGRVTTVFVRQGHYALDAETVASYPAPDVVVESIDGAAQRRRSLPA